MPSFEMIVVGAGGGPLETDLSCYLFKDYRSNWDNGIISLEAGSGLGALTNLLTSTPDLFGDMARLPRPSLAAAAIMSHVHTYLITHAHMDHILGLVLSAGSGKGDRKKIVSTKTILMSIETVFQDRLWPNLASWDATDLPHNYLYSQINSDNQYHKITPNILARAMPLSHGRTTKEEDYPSLAYFLRHKSTNHEFLFFGDVEPDSISGKGTNKEVWRAAAPLIVSGTLLAIFLECSWPSGRSDSELYGHLTPQYFVEELRALAREVTYCREARTLRRSTIDDPDSQPPLKRLRSVADESDSALRGLRVYVIHCKEPMEDMKDPRPISQIIVSQIKSLTKPDLGAEIIAAEQGMRIII